MPFRFARRFLAVAAVIVTVVIGLTLLRLSAGPVNLDFLADPLASALSRPERGFIIRFGGMSLDADGGLAIEARDVRVLAPNGRVLARSPEARLGISRSALLHGVLALSTVDLVGVRVRLYRQFDGTVRFTLANPADESAEAEPPGAQFDLSEFLRRPDPSKSTGYLRRISVSDGTVILLDERTDTIWRAPGSNFTISRDSGRIAARLHTTIDAPGGKQRLDASGRIELASGEASLDLSVDGLRLAALAPLLPALERASALDMALDATASVRFAEDGSVRQGRFRVSGRNGVLALGTNEAPGIRIDGLELSGLVGPGGESISFERARLVIGDSVTTARGSLGFERDSIRIDASLSGLNPAAIMAQIPSVAETAQVSVPLKGHISARLSRAGDLAHLDYVFEGEGGSVTVMEPVPVSRLSLSGSVTGAGEIRVDRLLLDLDGPVIEASGRAGVHSSGLTLDAEVVARNTPVNSLDALWPPNVAPGGRRWITENLSDGRVGEANLTLSTMVGSAAAESPEEISGSLTFDGVSVRYWEPLPAFREVAGRATFAGRSFDIELKSGRLGEISLRKGKVLLTGLGLEPGHERADINVTFGGPMSQILTVLDNPPLGYAKWLEVDPAQIGGEALATLSVELPLLDDLDLEDVEISAQAELREVIVPGIVLGKNLAGADLTLDLDKTRLRLAGEGRLAGMHSQLEVVHAFEGDTPGSRIEVGGVLTDKARAALYPAAASHVSGPVPMQLTMSEDADGITTIKAGFDLQDASLSFPLAGWSKAASIPGRAKVSLQLENERLVRIESFKLNAGTGYAKGSAIFTAGGDGLKRLEIDRLRLGERTDLTVQADFPAEGEPVIRLTGPTLDISPLWTGSKETSGGTGSGGGDELAIVARLDQLWIGGSHPIQAVDGHFRLADGTLRSGEMRGAVGEGNGVSLTVAEAEGERRLQFRLEDTGAALRTLGWIDSISGGELEILANRPLNPTDAPWHGVAETDAFRLSDAPLLARILAAASFTGLADLSSRDAGISFQKLEAPFTFGGDRLKLEPGRAYGGALGITFFGSVDLESDNIDVAGTIVPAYTVNRVLGSIPILGDILTGEKGSGLFAATYRVRGPIDEPEVNVNPLAALAPGFLRNLFREIVGGSPDGAPTPDPAAESFPGNLN